MPSAALEAEPASSECRKSLVRGNCLKHSHVTIKNPARGRGGEYLVGAVIAISSVATKGSFLARLKWGDSRHAVFVGNARKNS